MIVMFFGYPGAGKTTLVQRFGRLFGVIAIDTDQYMTPAERHAAASGAYTQAMRLANIGRYCTAVRQEYAGRSVALADGLPNNEARRFLLAQFAPGEVTLVLVQSEPALWEARLRARKENAVSIDVDAARDYIAANWEPVAPSIPYSVLENGPDAASSRRSYALSAARSV